MLETFIATLITSLLGLLAFLAYRHPVGFGRINFILLPLSVLGGGFLIGWDNAITESTLSLERLFSNGEHAIGQRAISQVNGLASPIWAYAALFAWLVYLAALTALPWILKFTSPHSTRQSVSSSKKH
jgi:hypothetical protein